MWGGRRKNYSKAKPNANILNYLPKMSDLSGVPEALRNEFGLKEIPESCSLDLLFITLKGESISPSAASCFNRFRLRDLEPRLLVEAILVGSGI